MDERQVPEPWAARFRIRVIKREDDLERDGLRPRWERW